MTVTEPHETHTIRVFGLEDTDPARADRLPFRRPAELRVGRGEIPVEQFRQRVGQFLESMKDVLADLPATIGSYGLEEIQVSAEVSAKGRLSLLGTGGELAGASGLVFTFRRADRPAPRTGTGTGTGMDARTAGPGPVRASG
jgi:hypothetical protein